MRRMWYNQQWYKTAIRYGVGACVTASAIFIVWRYGFSEKLITTVTVVADPRLSPSARESLRTFVENFCLKEPRVDFSEHAKKTFNCIKNTAHVRKQRTHMYVKFDAHTPAVLLNNEHIVTQGGLLIGVQFYRSDILLTLPHIVTQDLMLPAELCQLASWAITIPEAVRDAAMLVWKNPTEIELFFKEYPKNPVLVTTKTELSTNFITNLKKILVLDDVKAIDARFDGMFVAVHEKKIKNKRRR